MNRAVNPTPKFPFGVFFAVFIFVFTLVFGISIVVTSLTPKTYMSEARIKVNYKSTSEQWTQSESRAYDSTLTKTESKIINSEVMMKKVINDLDLNNVWGKKYNSGGALKTWETLKALSNNVSIHPIPGTALISIREYDGNPGDAAMIVNSFVKCYLDYAGTNKVGLDVQVVDDAYSDKIPVGPNKVINYFMGIVAGVLLGLVAGTIVSLIVFLKNRNPA